MIDINEQIRTVARAVADRVVDGRPAKAVQLTQTFPTDLDDLWDAVTNPERIPRWLSPIDGELRLGGRYQLEGNAAGTITACEAPYAFDATWEFDGNVSWIEVRLSPVDHQRTQLALTHLAHPDDHWEQFGPGAAGIGWDLSFLGLALYLRGGTERPPEADDWPTTPEGVQFMTDSGQAWRVADVVGGADPSVADASAQRTIDAYTQPPAS